jgi:transcription elongation factor GreA
VRVGSTVKGADEKGKAFEYTIVGSTEPIRPTGRLSNESPVGKALLGRGQGDTVDVLLPNGRTRALTIEGISVA